MKIWWYLDFVERFGDDHAPFPCSAEHVALHATWLARVLTYQSVVNYLLGLNHFLKLSGVEGISYGDYIVQATLKGICRQKGDTPRQAPPLLPVMLLCMFAFLTLNTGHVAWRAAMLCSFRALLRKSIAGHRLRLLTVEEGLLLLRLFVCCCFMS